MPPSASSNLPEPAATAPVKAPLLVAEQLALQQVLRDGGAVDRDEGPRRRGAQVVQRAGEQLLAGAALAQQQHADIGRRHLLDRPAEREHRSELVRMPWKLGSRLC